MEEGRGKWEMEGQKGEGREEGGRGREGRERKQAGCPPPNENPGYGPV